jgi:hypothetical protein
MFLTDLSKWHKTNRYRLALDSSGIKRTEIGQNTTDPVARFEPKSLALTTPKTLAQIEAK